MYPFSNTSKPSLSGIRIRFNLLNSVSDLFLMTSQISNLAALLPISIAARINLVYLLPFKNLYVCSCDLKGVAFSEGTYLLLKSISNTLAF